MAFTGTPVVVQVSDEVCRITGVSLVAAAAGTISLHGGAGEIVLPTGFQPKPDGNVTLVDALDVSNKIDAAAAAFYPVWVGKTGSTPTTFLATLTNGASIEGHDTSELEIYVKFHT